MENNQIGLNILDLSDYDLLQILKHCTSTDLWQLSRTCSRFRCLVITKKLWKKIDLQDAPITDEKITFGFHMVNELTEDVRLCSSEQDLELTPLGNLQVHLNNANLTILALENQKLCGYKINVANFPRTLVELSLRKTKVSHPPTFLYLGHKQMINLKVLILDECCWVNRLEMFQLSMYESLEILSMYSCKHIHDTDIPYINLINKRSFRALRILDCRFSPLINDTLHLLHRKPTVQEIYFQNYHSSYFLDRHKRELDIACGSPVRNHSYLSDLDDIAMCEKKTANVSCGETLFFFFDECIQESPASSEYKSILYERPYRKCTCFKNNLYSQMSKMKSLKARELVKTEKLQCEPSIKNCYTTDSRLLGRKRKHENSDEETDHKKVTVDERVAQPTKHMGGVKRLSLRGYEDVTDLTLFTLTKLNLKLLDVTYTSVTEVGVKEFTAINSECRVVHESLCKCRPKMHF